MTEPEDLAILEAAFPLAYCPDCGYSRAGLPTGHTCPECGWTEVGPMVVLYTDRAPKTTESVAWQRLAMPLSFALGLLGYQIFDRLLPFRAETRALIAAGVAVVLVTIGYLSHRRNTRENGGAYQVRLCPQGYAVRPGVGQSKLVPWPRRIVIKHSRSIGGRRWFKIGTRVPILNMIYGYFVVIPINSDEKVAQALTRTCTRWSSANAST